VTDDGQRAQLAMDVFGQKAGAKLANAIRPGVESIDHFKISTQEATGATEKAADALDSTFGARAQLLLNKFGSALRSLGSDWGPLLTGAASAGTLLTTVFGDDLVRKLGPNVVKAFKALGEKGGDALADGISNVTQGAGGTVAGNFIASRIETMVDSTKNSRIAAAIRTGAAKAGALWGVFFAGAQGIASTLYTGVAGAIAKTPIAGAVRAAILAAAIELGTLEGTALGTAIGAATQAALIAAPIVIPILLIKAAGDIIDPAGLKGQLNQITSDVNSGKKVWVDAGSQGGQAYVDAAAGAIDTKLGPAINDGLERTGRAVNPAPLATAVSTVVSSSIARAIPWVKIAREQGNRLSGAVAQGIHDAREKPWQAWQTMLEALSHEQKPAEERAHLLGALVTARLAQGLRSKDPELRAQAIATKQAILDRLAELSPNAHNIGVKGMESLRKAMHSKDGDIRTAALAIYNAATRKIDDLPAKGTSWGQAYGRNLAAGIASYRHEVEQAASLLAGAAGSYHKLSSPAKRGPWSELGGPEGWGRRYAAFLSKGIAAGIPDVNAAIAKGMRFAGFDAPFLNRLVSDPHGPIGRHSPAASSSSVRHGDVSIGAIHLHGVGSDVSQPAARGSPGTSSTRSRRFRSRAPAAGSIRRSSRDAPDARRERADADRVQRVQLPAERPGRRAPRRRHDAGRQRGPAAELTCRRSPRSSPTSSSRSSRRPPRASPAGSRSPASRTAASRCRSTRASACRPTSSRSSSTNEDGALGWGSTSIFPTNSRIKAFQWYGDVANEVQVFDGLIDNPKDHRDVRALTLTCRDRFALLIDQTFSASAPQAPARRARSGRRRTASTSRWRCRTSSSTSSTGSAGRPPTGRSRRARTSSTSSSSRRLARTPTRSSATIG
jgi:hypothetical protein